MRTSATQFELMVTFMEQHGDLNKPSSNARGRINNLKDWDELVQLLNSDGSGDTKSVEKWKKVTFWLRYGVILKTIFKKKAARIHRATYGTGGGPANTAKLTDLEQRVLNIIGVQVATGLAVEEAGLSEVIHIQPQQSTATLSDTVQLEFSTQISSSQPPSQRRAVSSPPLAFVEEEVHRSQPWNEPGPSTAYVATTSTPPQARVASPHIIVEQQMGEVSPTRPSPVRIVRPEPALSGHTTPRRRGRPPGRLGPPPSRTEQATQHFLQADEYWRKFKQQQHRDYMEIRREQNRIRELEVQANMSWQTVAMRVTDLLDKLVDKYCKD